MALTYAQLTTDLANMIVVPATDPNYLIVLPNIIADAENRLYRDLDILNTVVRDTGGAFTAGSRNFTLPQTSGRFVVTNNVNFFTPVTANTNRRQLIPVSRDFLDAVYPDEAALACCSGSEYPKYYAMITDQQIIVGPAPGEAFTVEVIGTIRPTPLSATNTTTYLSLYLEDLFFTACLIFAAGYQQNFSSMADNPQQALSWQAHYDATIGGAQTEEQRKRYAAQAWTSMQPAALATPPRV